MDPFWTPGCPTLITPQPPVHSYLHQLHMLHVSVYTICTGYLHIHICTRRNQHISPLNRLNQYISPLGSGRIHDPPVPDPSRNPHISPASRIRSPDPRSSCISDPPQPTHFALEPSHLYQHIAPHFGGCTFRRVFTHTPNARICPCSLSQCTCVSSVGPKMDPFWGSDNPDLMPFLIKRHLWHNHCTRARV